ncbi:hypothetical protein [Acetivibrio mesophilus]|uniref:Uncharacterized protein n=1 Tax=Acetivibrio mesophilus TaxID=2487273 RepID=A0A4Q0I4J6_9FIRM|nr:hypothetical protein [Acetivibrio mesophilus]ODM27703.1 hypothetical protein A7W90_16595 [Clostridium sp. Bc-iso-3]RXE58645.1 hypothetical protein EFD62_11510 [Acetivibrio mesophilus]HHV30140.1 hypothetical protein [Clostridium sp.]
MTKSIEELLKEIELKNIVLKDQCHSSCCLKKQELEKAERELDSLLYRFYKIHKCNLCKISREETMKDSEKQ